MGIEILESEDGNKAMYCNTSMWAFGPVFDEEEDVDGFLIWLNPYDPRQLSDKELEASVAQWRTIRTGERKQEDEDYARQCAEEKRRSNHP